MLLRQRNIASARRQAEGELTTRPPQKEVLGPPETSGMCIGATRTARFMETTSSQPVNLAAIGYGLCEDGREAGGNPWAHGGGNAGKRTCSSGRSISFLTSPMKARLGTSVSQIREWGHFLSWGEIGRCAAYAKSQPDIAVKYIKNILEKYEADGLCLQRYLRNSQHGAGENILAGNCMPVVGWYRDVLRNPAEAQPRLYLEPHLTRT